MKPTPIDPARPRPKSRAVPPHRRAADRRAAGQSRHAGRGRCAGVRRYLKEFLSDPRVIEDQGLVWKLVLNGIILPMRPRAKPATTSKIWNTELNESPLKTITRAQAEKLAAALAPLGRRIVVDWAMRYGNPSIASRLPSSMAQGCERILVMPLYPQYSAATTATVCDEVFRVLMELRRQPTVRIAPPYYDDPVYIDALASSMRDRARQARRSSRSDPRLVPRHAGGVCRQGRSLSATIASRPCGCCASGSARREQADADVPVALRPRQMARALRPTQTVKALAKRGVEEPRGDHARLLRRLPGDAGGDRGRERAHLPQAMAARISPPSLPQRQRRRACW